VKARPLIDRKIVEFLPLSFDEYSNYTYVVLRIFFVPVYHCRSSHPQHESRNLGRLPMPFEVFGVAFCSCRRHRLGRRLLRAPVVVQVITHASFSLTHNRRSKTILFPAVRFESGRMHLSSSLDGGNHNRTRIHRPWPAQYASPRLTIDGLALGRLKMVLQVCALAVVIAGAAASLP